jgi:signal transduction histidine kinase
MNIAHTMTDDQLIDELQARLKEKRQSKDAREMLKQVEEVSARLREAEQVKSYFLSNIRNEINNPLASILGLSKTIADSNISDAERIRFMANLIHQEAFGLDFQIRNIIAAAEIESGEVAPDLSSINITSLVESVAALFEPRIKHRQVVVKIDSEDKNLLVNSDPYMLQMMLTNLLANAIEFSFPGNDILLKVRINSDHDLILSVKDYGIGIDAFHQKQLFNRFQQLDAGSTKQHQGHGLGLAIVNEFADALGGTVAVHSEKGKGAEFVITLPEFSIDKVVKGIAMEGNTVLFSDEEKF